jgi:hypothetical protein
MLRGYLNNWSHGVALWSATLLVLVLRVTPAESRSQRRGGRQQVADAGYRHGVRAGK